MNEKQQDCTHKMNEKKYKMYLLVGEFEGGLCYGIKSL